MRTHALPVLGAHHVEEPVVEPLSHAGVEDVEEFGPDVWLDTPQPSQEGRLQFGRQLAAVFNRSGYCGACLPFTIKDYCSKGKRHKREPIAQKAFPAVATLVFPITYSPSPWSRSPQTNRNIMPFSQ